MYKWEHSLISNSFVQIIGAFNALSRESLVSIHAS